VSKSYKSAVPTWTTYTPYVSPISTQAPINQEVFWRNRARQWSPPSIQGQLNRIAMGIDASVKGTGAAHYVEGILGNRPISNYLGSKAGPPRNLWARRMQEAVQMGTPETMTAAPGEETPFTERQVRTAHTAPATVNPADVATQANAREAVSTLANAAGSSAQAGTASIPQVTFAPGFQPPGGRPHIILPSNRTR